MLPFGKAEKAQVLRLKMDDLPVSSLSASAILGCPLGHRLCLTIELDESGEFKPLHLPLAPTRACDRLCGGAPHDLIDLF